MSWFAAVVVLVFALMPSQSPPVLGLAKAIQLSVAPVFLLTALSGLLGVISSRLTRVLDRAREQQGREPDPVEMALMKRRMSLLTRAIESVTLTGVLVAAVVAITFVSAIAVIDLAAIVVPMFVLAMIALVVGLLLLLADTRLASQLIRRRF